MKKRLFSIVLALVLCLSLLPMSAFAVSYSDIEGHWAEDTIVRWSDYGMIQGSNGQFRPYGTLTRAHMATMLARLLNLPEAKSAGFTDTAGHWAEDAIDRCAAAGILLGDEGKANPDAPITRQQAMTMLCRALQYRKDATTALNAFADADKVSSYAAGYMAALVNDGVVLGNKGKLDPLSYINRGQMVAIIDRMIDYYASGSGQTISAGNGGLVLVVAKDVSIVDAPAGTTVVVGKDAAGLKVNGVLIAAGQSYTVPAPGTAVPSSHDHTYATTWSFDDDYHWHAATCGHDVINNKAAHSYENGVCVCGQREVAAEDVVARINGVKYASLSSAIKSASDGDTIVLAKDVNAPNSSYSIRNKTITIDLNGCTVTGKGENAVFYVTTGNLTINDSQGGGGVVAVESNNHYAMAVRVNNGSKKVIINGGSFSQQLASGTTITAASQYDLIYAQKGTIEINGGTFDCETSKWTLNCEDKNYKEGTAKITVTGGTFVGYDPASSAEAGNASFVADGYQSTKASDKDEYTVSPIFANGKGTASDPFQVTSADDVAALASSVNDGASYADKYIKLTEDVEVTDWLPVGQKDGNKFGGTFDGNGHTVTVTGISTNTGSGTAFDEYVGFFGAVSSTGTVKDLTVAGSISGKNAAGIVARLDGGTVENCINKAAVTGTSKTGGVVCLANNGSTIKNCKNEGAITASGTAAAGVVAYLNENSTIESCENSATVDSGAQYTGGVVGHSNVVTKSVKVSNCKNTGAVNSTYTGSEGYAGGIYGVVMCAATGGKDGKVHFENCENSGAVSGTTNVGGIAGMMAAGSMTGCTNTGTVTATATVGYAGGIAGVVGGSGGENSSTGVTLIDNCSGGNAVISAVHAGRIMGLFNGLAGHNDAVTELKLLDRAEGDTMATIGAMAKCSTNVNLMVTAGTLYGEITVIGYESSTTAPQVKIELAEGISWIVDDTTTRTGTYTRAGSGGSWTAAT